MGHVVIISGASCPPLAGGGVRVLVCARAVKTSLRDTEREMRGLSALFLSTPAHDTRARLRHAIYVRSL